MWDPCVVGDSNPQIQVPRWWYLFGGGQRIKLVFAIPCYDQLCLHSYSHSQSQSTLTHSHAHFHSYSHSDFHSHCHCHSNPIPTLTLTLTLTLHSHFHFHSLTCSLVGCGLWLAIRYCARFMPLPPLRPTLTSHRHVYDSSLFRNDMFIAQFVMSWLLTMFTTSFPAETALYDDFDGSDIKFATLRSSPLASPTAATYHRATL